MYLYLIYVAVSSVSSIHQLVLHVVPLLRSWSDVSNLIIIQADIGPRSMSLSGLVRIQSRAVMHLVQILQLINYTYGYRVESPTCEDTWCI